MTYDNNNIFAKIIRGEAPAKKVYEDEQVLAFHNIFPTAPIHILVIPKGNYTSLVDFIENADEKTVKHLFSCVKQIAEDLQLIDSGFRIISNHGSDAMQTVKHFHVHILGGKPLKEY